MNYKGENDQNNNFVLKNLFIMKLLTASLARQFCPAAFRAVPLSISQHFLCPLVSFAPLQTTPYRKSRQVFQQNSRPPYQPLGSRRASSTGHNQDCSSAVCRYLSDRKVPLSEFDQLLYKLVVTYSGSQVTSTPSARSVCSSRSLRIAVQCALQPFS